jgi:putative aldouronate transport system substrate-binding protein
MKPFKKSLLLVMSALLLSVSVMSGCTKSSDSASEGKTSQTDGNAANVKTSDFPIVSTPITLTVFGQKDANHAAWKDVLVFKEYEKKTNIKMDFQEFPTQGFLEKKNLLFASNELPDIFLRANLTASDIARFGVQDKMLLPLEGLIDQYAPNIKKLFDQYPEARKSVTAPDGHIYTLPQMKVLGSENTDKIWLNKVWMEKLNLKTPTNEAELIDVLKAFRDKDPNGNKLKDEIPLGIRDMGMAFTAFAGSFGLEKQMEYWLNIKDNKVTQWVTDPRFKEMLQFLNTLYKEKLLYADFYKGDIPKWRSNLSQGLIGNFFIQASDPFINIEQNYTGMAPIIGPHGDQIYSQVRPIASPIGAFAISKTNKNPEASLRWVDYFYSEEGSIFFRFGVEGQTYTMKDGKPIVSDSILKDSRGAMAALGEVNLVPGGGFPHLIIDKSGGMTNNDKVREMQTFIEKYEPMHVYGDPIFDKATSERVLPIKADVDKFLNESVAKFIIGELSFDKWDEYVATLKKMKIDDLEQAYQQAYDAMNK